MWNQASQHLIALLCSALSFLAHSTEPFNTIFNKSCCVYIHQPDGIYWIKSIARHSHQTAFCGAPRYHLSG
ncbi:hypothetical protein EDC01DRAFT_660410 [Geopyxis carbonaria]|nr:hypothetical protein EDC01DRAFT_681608 [Geopyxis carbonaria]KAI5788509.1 hypothetical protein EDC01DRAFT_660410 [Geopyxis carbonaria]